MSSPSLARFLLGRLLSLSPLLLGCAFSLIPLLLGCALGLGSFLLRRILGFITLLLRILLGITRIILRLVLLLESKLLGLLGLLVRKVHRRAGFLVRKAGSLIVFFGGVVCAFVLLLTEEGSEPGEGVACDDEAGGDHGFAAGDVAVPTAFFVLARVGVEQVVFAIADDAEGEVGVVEDCAFDFLGVLLHDGEVIVDFGEAVRGERVGFGDVGGYVAVGTLGVGDEGRNEFLVAGAREVESFGAVWV